MDKTLVGARIRALRKSLRMSQKEFAKAINTNQPSLSFYERGQLSPSMDLLIQISDYADISLEWLCGISEEREKMPLNKSHILYKVFYNQDLVYIGRTSQPLKKRLYGHFSKAPMMRHLDVRKVTKIEFAELKTQADLFLYEIYYINKWKPALNRDDKSKEPLTIELPPLDFKMFECDLLPKWREIAEKRDVKEREISRQKRELEDLKRTKRHEIFQDSSLDHKEKIDKFSQWYEDVYEPLYRKIKEDSLDEPFKTSENDEFF